MISFVVIVLFVFYAILDAIALLPRVAGSMLGKNGLGYTFSIMVQTLKRIFVVSYPPLLGWISLHGGSLYPTIYAAYFFGFIAVVLISVIKYPLIKYFMHLIDGYLVGGSLVYSIFKHKQKNHDFMVSDKAGGLILKLDKSLVFSSAWVYFIYGSSLFLINVFGSKFSEHSAVIYQLVGIINALGTMLMSFYLDPKISRNFDHQADVMVSNDSVVAGQILSLGILGPVSIFAFSLIL